MHEINTNYSSNFDILDKQGNFNVFEQVKAYLTLFIK